MNLWTAMQFVESNRHHAERLDSYATPCSFQFRSLLSDVAAQRRELAQQMAALAMDEPIPTLTRRWFPPSRT